MTKINLYLIFTESFDNRHNNINNSLEIMKNLCAANDITLSINIITEPSCGFIDSNIETYNSRVDYAIFPDDNEYNENISLLNSFQISNYEKHREVYKKITEYAASVTSDTSEDTYYMIMEDDILVSKNYIENIDDMLKDIKKAVNNNWDILFTSLNTINNSKDNFVNYNTVYNKLISKACYFIKPSMCAKLYDEMKTFKLGLKFLLSKYIKDHSQSDSVESSQSDSVVPMFYNKNTFVEGSKYGIYPSTVNPNNFLYFNNNFIELSKISNIEFVNHEVLERAKEIYSSVENINSADIQNIMGIIYYRNKDYGNAKKYTRLALSNHKKNKGYLQKNSDILNNCINMFQFEQDMLEECMKEIPKY
jgi:GR25 family glycosyltransferase involved in LPS biosynthesis